MLLFHQAQHDAADMVASDLMTKTVISVTADASVHDVAKQLLESNVGALPVTDSSCNPVGMVSDGDLLGRRTGNVRKDWWLDLLAQPKLSAPVLESARTCSVRDVMTTPLISISPSTPVREIARLLQLHRIKRLPVVLDDKLVGIVSRGDMLSIVSHLPKSVVEGAATSGGLYGLLQSLAGGAQHTAAPDSKAPPEVAKTTEDISADEFRNLVTESQKAKLDEAAEAKRLLGLESEKQVKAMLDQHVTDESWEALLNHAALAAKYGKKDLILLRFPAGVCSDGGREISNVQEGWEKTLRGEAAEMYMRWRHDLKPKGFGLAVPILSFANGMVGDFGLVLTWDSQVAGAAA